jgi:hypothetical protein
MREQSFMTLVAMSALPAWLWVGYAVQEGCIGAPWAIGLMALIGGTCWLTYRLHVTRYPWAVGILLTAELIFISAMLYLLRDPDVGYLFVAVIVTAILFGPPGACLAAAVVTLVELGLSHALAGSTALPRGLGAHVVLNVIAACDGPADRQLHPSIAHGSMLIHGRIHPGHCTFHHSTPERAASCLGTGR